MGRPHRDDASTHVLEAVIIATIMISAVAFVATFESPPTGSTPARDILQQQAEDALAILSDTPIYGSSYGDNMLSVFLAECMQGDCSNMTKKLGRLLPAGSSFALYISNGYETFPIVVTKSPPGEAVSARRLLEPHWSYTFTSTGMAVVNNWTDPLVTYALPVFNSNVIAPSGSPLKVHVEGKKLGDGSSFSLQAFYTTIAVDASKAALYPAASLNFLTNKTIFENGNDQLPQFEPGAFLDRTRETIELTEEVDPDTGTMELHGNGQPTNADLVYRMRLQETAGVPIPAGTLLTLSVPRGWNASGIADANWEIVKDATDWNASHNNSAVVARLKVPVAGAANPIEFQFYARYRGDVLNDYTFHATLSNGAEAEANLVVKADAWPADTLTYAVPGVHMSVPRPMGALAPTTWSLVVDIPYEPATTAYVSKKGVGPYATIDPRAGVVKATTSPGVAISRITITEENGAPIFGASVTPGALHQGGWESHGTYLEWDGYHLSTKGPLNLTFSVAASGTQGVQAPKPSLVPPVTFDGYQGRALDQVSPGLYRSAILPNNTTGAQYDIYWQGYASDPIDAATAKMHKMSADSVYKATLLAGSTNYTMNPVAPFHDGIYGSYVAVEKRSVPIGGHVVLTADVQSVLYALSQAGQSAGVNLTFYPPWTGNSHKPIWWQDNLESSVVTSEITQLTMLDLNNDGYADPVVGTNQGRVYALDALTGERLQGNVWIAETFGRSAASVAAITALETFEYGGESYILVGTDAQSNLYVLDKTLDDVWEWEKTVAVTSVDTVDFDEDGDLEILASFTDNTVSVLEIDPNDRDLVPIEPAATVPKPGAFYHATGTAGIVRGLSSAGRDELPGFGLSIFEKPGAYAGVRVSASNNAQPSANPPQVWASVPRAGLDVVDSDSTLLWQFLAGPVNVQRAFDGNGDAKTDVLVGTSSGYVSLMNGVRGSSPMSGGLLVPSQEIKDAHHPDVVHGAVVTDDGGVYFTRDRWNTIWCVNCDPSYSVGNVDNRLAGVSLAGREYLWAVGEGGAVWRTIPNFPTGQPWMEPTTLSASKGAVPFDVSAMGVDLHDVHFTYDDDGIGQEGWVVGASPAGVCGLPPLLADLCEEATLVHTQDGGATWYVMNADDADAQAGEPATMAGLNGARVTSTLRRISFTTDQIGWITGDEGTLLRTLDGGAHFQQIAIPTTDDVSGISCLVDGNGDVTCLLSTTTGKLYRGVKVEDDQLVAWADVTTTLGADWDRAIFDVALAEEAAYVASSDALMASWDGGLHWSKLPQSYVRVNFARLNVFPDNTGFVWGGNATAGFIGFLVSYERHAKAQTVRLFDADAELPAGAKIVGINITARQSTGADGVLEWSVSADGGAHWKTADPPVATPTPYVDGGVNIMLPTDKIVGYVVDDDHWGRDPRLKLAMWSPSDSPHSASFVQDSILAEVMYRLEGSDENVTRAVTIDLATDPMLDLDPAKTTATWRPELQEIGMPLVPKLWTTNVSGEVLDIRTGFDVNGDGTDEVWVATGNTLAENNPEYQIYTGFNLDEPVESDNQVYLLDGKTGAILAESDAMTGSVLAIQVLDQDATPEPDVLFALAWDALNPGVPRGGVYALDPLTLDPILVNGDPWTRGFAQTPPVDLEAGLVGAEIAAPYYITTSAQSTTGLVLGGLYALDGPKPLLRWSSFSADRGHYLVETEIPKSWFFGPYVVEVRVEWSDNVDVTRDGVTTTETVLQAARFYDYFLVTPPDALSPPSPLYDVHLVSWFDDWR